MTTLAEKRQSREVATLQPAGDVIEDVLIRGDLKSLTPEQRNQYYLRLCHVTGLNPLTQPFEYLTLNNKLVLYARKSCTDQLRALHGVSVVDMDQEEREGLYSVTVKVRDKHGREDMDIGSVNIGGLKGEARANAIMKASTKAKRRATLSICGLGLLDETEVETIPGAVSHPEAAGGAPHASPPPRQQQPTIRHEAQRFINNAKAKIATAGDDIDAAHAVLDALKELPSWKQLNAAEQAAIREAMPRLPDDV